MNNSGKAEEYHVRNGDHEETVIMKLPKTYEEQVEIIKKKGFIVDDDKMCKSFLKQANYYRLSAYFLPFRKTDGTYYENINFNKFKQIYKFDGRIRNLIFEILSCQAPPDCIQKLIQKLLGVYLTVTITTIFFASSIR